MPRPGTARIDPRSPRSSWPPEKKSRLGNVCSREGRSNPYPLHAELPPVHNLHPAGLSPVHILQDCPLYTSCRTAPCTHPAGLSPVHILQDCPLYTSCRTVPCTHPAGLSPVHILQDCPLYTPCKTVRFFSGSSHTSDLNIGTPVATLPGAWRYRVSAGFGRPCVSIP